ncbi:MAG: DUF3576 domain-containing protein [Alphaproteobacteria bacterium]
MNGARGLRFLAVLGLAGFFLAACGGGKQTLEPMAAGQAKGTGQAYVMGDDEDGTQFISTDGREGKNATGLGVNGYLWRASLDTLSFMPLASADPVGGVIITDWYTAPETPAERFKVQVYLLDRRLRADALRVNVFRQEQNTTVGWVDAAVAQETKTKMENAILTRARELRVNGFAER